MSETLTIDHAVITLANIREEKKRLAKQESELVHFLADQLGVDAEAGSKTTNLSSGVKVAVTKPVSYAVANDEYQAAAWSSSVPAAVHQKYLTWKATLTVKEFKSLQSAVDTEIAMGEKDTANQKILRGLEDLITTKNGKPQVKLTMPE